MVLNMSLAKPYKCLFVDITVSLYDRHPIYYLCTRIINSGHQALYLNSSNPQTICQYINQHDIDVVLYTSFSNMLLAYNELDKKIKLFCPKVFSILGGPGVTQRQEREMLVQNETTLNALCIGEGEVAIEKFLNNEMAFEKNIIPPYQIDPLEGYHKFVDVNELDFPNRDVVYQSDHVLRDMPSKQFMGGRGCPYRCTYCHNHTINQIFKDSGRILRLKTPEYIIAEVKEVQRHYPLNKVIFQDDIFFFNRKWSFDFAQKWASQVGLPWSCNVRPDYLNEDLIRALSESNCQTVSWSIESGNEFLRNKILDRRMSNDVILNCAELLNKYNIQHRTGNIIGIPGEKIDNIYETIELNINSRPNLANAHIFVPFKGLKLTNYALSEGYVKQEDLEDVPDTYFKKTVLDFPQEEKKLIKKLMYVFPIVVNYPFMYYNKSIFGLFLKLSDPILFVLNKVFVGYKTSVLFKVQGSLIYKSKVLMRFLRFGT